MHNPCSEKVLKIPFHRFGLQIRQGIKSPPKWCDALEKVDSTVIGLMQRKRRGVGRVENLP
jgi:hypothetical protein